MFNKYYSDVNQIKELFRQNFSAFINEHKDLKILLFDIFVHGTAYAVGGYFRDILRGNSPRDIDIIVDIDHTQLLQKINMSNMTHIINRHNGIKLKLEGGMDVDIWSIENNWAFKENLIKLNPEDKLNSIATGCFYNYDALVINLHNFNFNIRYYKDFESTRMLDILRKNPLYKNLNPTTEANILRAFYIRKTFGINFTENTNNYLREKIGYLHGHYESASARLIEIKQRYPKYETFLSAHEVDKSVVEIMSSGHGNYQLPMPF